MRLWSIHPKYLDTKGLCALWRESLLAQKVLKGKTEGYRNHPQLERFRKHPHPQVAIAGYLMGVLKESQVRGHRFDARKIEKNGQTERIQVTKGQLRYEFDRLLSKLRTRDPRKFHELRTICTIESHPMFEIRPGKTEEWERVVTEDRP